MFPNVVTVHHTSCAVGFGQYSHSQLSTSYPSCEHHQKIPPKNSIFDMMELVKEVYKQVTMRKVGPSPPAHFHLQVMGVMTETPRAFPRNQGNRQEGLVLFWMRN